MYETELKEKKHIYVYKEGEEDSWRGSRFINIKAELIPGRG
jgi:hypothetical protein